VAVIGLLVQVVVLVLLAEMLPVVQVLVLAVQV
jgi:hypothetical protein